MRTQESSPDERASYYHNQIRRHSQKYANFDWPTIETFLSFIYTYHRAGDTMEELFNQYGLSRSTFNALMILSRSHPQGCIQQDISKLLLVSRANITGVLNGLVRKGLVLRSLHPTDRRAKRIKISKKGEDLLKNLVPEYHKKVSQCFRFLETSEKKSLKNLLKKIQLGLEKN